MRPISDVLRAFRTIEVSNDNRTTVCHTKLGTLYYDAWSVSDPLFN